MEKAEVGEKTSKKEVAINGVKNFIVRLGHSW